MYKGQKVRGTNHYQNPDARVGDCRRISGTEMGSSWALSSDPHIKRSADPAAAESEALTSNDVYKEASSRNDTEY